MRKRAIWLALSGLTIAVIVTIAWKVHHRPHLEVTMAQATSGSIGRRIVASGTLEAVKTVDVGAQVSGSLASIDVDFNSRVRSGEQLARIDPSFYDAQVAQAKAALTQAEADLAGYKV